MTDEEMPPAETEALSRDLPAGHASARNIKAS